MLLFAVEIENVADEERGLFTMWCVVVAGFEPVDRHQPLLGRSKLATAATAITASVDCAIVSHATDVKERRRLLAEWRGRRWR